MGVRELLNLEGRTALITGASGGLGLQMARALGEMGARCAVRPSPDRHDRRRGERSGRPGRDRHPHQQRAGARSLAGEWGQHNITVNCLASGYIPTRMSQHTLDTWGEEHLRKQVPLHRIASPEDLSGIAVLLASEASRHLTGQTIAVDGGITVI
ncbi:MAG TPA: SDR family oxidoreductase [Variovorax sp.]|nr:SDR family oxidoreductase [Variovorax sp.]